MTSSANSSRLLRTTQWICELYIVELRIYEVFDSKERKIFEKYEKKISMSLNVLAGVHGLSSTLQARSAYRLPCRRARPIVYLAGVHGLSSTSMWAQMSSWTAWPWGCGYYPPSDRRNSEKSQKAVRFISTSVWTPKYWTEYHADENLINKIILKLVSLFNRHLTYSCGLQSRPHCTAKIDVATGIL